MEYIQGVTITQYGFAEYDDLARLLVQLLDALDYIHRMGIFHLDVKPSNVLVELRVAGVGRVKLVDFGLARRALAGKEVGTYDFMAPEVLRPDLFLRGGAVDHRADLFSVGALAFQLITGLFLTGAARAAKSAEEMVRLYQRGPIACVDAHRSDVPRAFKNLLGRLLSIDPAARHATAFEAADELRRDFATAESFGLPADQERGEVFEYYEASGARHEVLVLLRAGRSGLIEIRGGPRYGRTRDLEEIAIRVGEEGVEVITCAYFESGDTTRTPQARIPQRVRHKRVHRLQELGERYPLLFRTGDARPVNPVEQLEDELVAIIRGETQDHPLVILVDDVQWCDHAFRPFLGAVARLLHEETGFPLIVVLAVGSDADRPAVDVDALLERHGTRSFEIPALDRQGIRAYLQSISDRWEGDIDELVTRLDLEAGGILGQMDDLLRQLRASEAIEVRSGIWRISSQRLAAASGGVAVTPASATMKLARLPLGASSLLQALAVFHPRPVPGGELRDVCEMTDGEVAEGLDVLVRLGYLRCMDRQYSFRTSSDRKAAYDGIQPDSAKAMLHGRVARHLEEKYRGNLEPRYPEIALHHALSDDPAAGRRHASEAARMLATSHQLSAALPHYDNAIRLYERSIEDGTAGDDDRRALASLYLGQAEAYSGVLDAEEALDRAVPLIQKAQSIAREVGDRLLQSRCILAESRAQELLWKHVEGEDRRTATTWRKRIETELKEISGRTDAAARAVRVELLDQLGWIYGREENHRESARVLKETLALAEALGRTGLNRILSRLASALAKDPDPAAGRTAIETAERALAAAREERDEYGIADAHRALAHAYAVNAHADLAEGELRAAAKLCERPTVGASKEAEILQPYGELLAELHRAEEAIPHIQRILSRSPDSLGSVASRAHFVMAKCLYRLCRYPAAREHLAPALAYAKRSPGSGRVPLLAQVNAYLGRIQIELGQYGAGSQTLYQAIDGARVDGKGAAPQHYFVADTAAYLGLARVRAAWAKRHRGAIGRDEVDEIAALGARSTGAYAEPYLAGEALLACAGALSGDGSGSGLARRIAVRVGDECARQEIPLTTFLLAVAFLVEDRPNEAEEVLLTMRRELQGTQQLDLEIGMEGLSMIALRRQGRLKPARRHKKKLAQLVRGVLVQLARPEEAGAFMDEPFRRSLLAEADELPPDGGEP